MTEILGSLNLADIKTAFYNNYKTYLSHIIDPLAVSPSLIGTDNSDNIFIDSQLSPPQFNGFFADNLQQALSTIDTQNDEISKTGKPYQVWFHPRNNGKELNSELKSKGFRYIGDDVGVAIELQGMNKKISYPKSLYIEPINNVERLEKWVEVAKLKFNYRGDNHLEYFERFKDVNFKEKRYWTKYIGWLNGEPSVVGTLILGGGIAMVYDETLLTHLNRNRWGIDDALVLKAMMDALDSGYKVGGVFSTIGELRKYFKLGFEEKCRLPKFVATMRK